MSKTRRRFSLRLTHLLSVGVLLSAAAVAAEPVDPLSLPNPFPRQLATGAELQKWDFTADTAGWRALNHCTVTAADGALQIYCTDSDPYLAASLRCPGGQLILRARIKSATDGSGQLFWSTDRQAGFTERYSQHFTLEHDGKWHEYTVPFTAVGELRDLRLDPGSAPGAVQLDWLAVHRGELPPLEIAAVEQHAQTLTVHVRNHSEQAVTATVNGTPLALAANAAAAVTATIAGSAPLEAREIVVAAPGTSALRRTVWIYRPEAALDRVTRTCGAVTLEAARDGSVARLLVGGRTVAALAPLIHRDHTLPKLDLTSDAADPLTFTGEGVTVRLGLAGDGELAIAIDSRQPVEGPVLRVGGALEQGLFAGLEYIEKGEHSSSTADIETPEHLRFAPDPMKVTMPLMAVVTAEAAVALTWSDMQLQPTFAAPDFVDGTAGQRLALRGQTIAAVMRLGPGWNQGGRVEDAVLWAVQRRGLPAVPPAPRSYDDQMQLSLAAYEGLIRDPQGGWYHATAPGRGGRGASFADHASAIWRITGRAPQTPHLAHGGAHVLNSASYFVTGRAAQWLQTINQQAQALIRDQQPDGSYRYDGPFRRGHWEDTASGICARPALLLLDHAWYTGNRESLAAGLKTLEYMKRFRVPRGAQTWELSLHTPDILASAYQVWAYVRGFELTGDPQWLAEARRWALSGVPFVYQWSNQPIMLYATVPVYGATHYKAPNWMGLPVQWCGTVYAYALLLLAPHDQTLDWRQLAEGILVAAEQMQYPDGPSKGCLPDVFNLPHQRRQPLDINPGALVSLRLLLAGKLDALAVATAGGHRIVAPYPVAIRAGQAAVQAVPGVDYQVVLDGQRIVDIHSQGTDRVPLE